LARIQPFLRFRFFVGGTGVGAGAGSGAVPARAVRMAAPLGLPQPVHASHPGPALKLPLLPEVMSWNVPATAAVC
jgi:hypothetical protein